MAECPASAMDAGAPATANALEPSAHLDRIETALWIFDVDDSRVIWANQAALGIWRAESAEALAQRDMSLDMSPIVKQRLRQYRDDFIAFDARFKECWTLYPNGEPETLNVSFCGVPLPSGRIGMLCEAQAEQPPPPDTLRGVDALMHTTVLISLFDQSGERLYANPAARAADARGAMLLAERFEDASDFAELMDIVASKGEARMTMRVRTAIGIRWHEIAARRCNDAATGLRAVMLSEHDVTNLINSEQRIREIALHDSLTGLLNRYALQSQFPELTQKARDCGKEVVVYLLDVDRFKSINDSLGHAAGDMLLIEVSRRLSACARGGDLVARFGGDEFLICRPETESEQGAFGEDLLASFAEPFVIGGRNFAITPSIGVSRHPRDGAEIGTLLKNADLALYEAKERGRNEARVYSEELRTKRDKRLRLEHDLEQALRNEEFFLDLQPRVCVRSNRVRSVEALLRWRRPSLGLVMPGAFISVCEETGLIRDIGLWVMDCCASLQTRLAEIAPEVGVSFNVSAREFADQGFVDAALDLAARRPCDVSRLEIEITETALSADEGATGALLARLKEAGFGIAIDDFGAGYSNLARLASYPITSLKLDRSLLSSSVRARPLVELAIALGHALGAKTVAEGVETPEQLSIVRDAGCAEYQGYLYSRPISESVLFELLEKERSALEAHA